MAEFMLNHGLPAHIHSYNPFVTAPHLPEALELPLFDAEQLAGLSADDGSVAWCVVQDGLPERRPNPQGADRDCILHTNKTYLFTCQFA